MKRSGAASKYDPQSSDRVRTHLIYFTGRAKRAQRKTKSRRGVCIVKNVVQHDAAVQTPYELDPSEWTGNQRVVHFGPMAYRDPMLYYYPKGWNVMYPAHFGFFPYRTRKFRGSSPIVCLSAFGAFFAIGGCAMICLAYSAVAIDGFVTVEPLKIAGPVLLAIGLLSLVSGCLWWLCSLHLFSEHLRHTQPHHTPPRKVVRQESIQKPAVSSDVVSNSPYHPPPIRLAVLENNYTAPALYRTAAEMKVYPPGFPRAVSPFSYTASSTVTYMTPYGTLQKTVSSDDRPSPPLVYENQYCFSSTDAPSSNWNP